MPHRVLVLDASQRSALAVVRSLGVRGLEVYTADRQFPTLAGTSKFSSRSFSYPDPSTAPADFIVSVADMVRTYGINFVLPMTDLSTMLLVEHPDQVAPAKLGCATAASYEALTVKSDLVQRAVALQIPVPETRVVHGSEELCAVARELAFPLVLKPSRSRYLHAGRVLSTQVRIAASMQELQGIIAGSHWLNHIPGLVQQFIPGFGAGIFTLGDGQNMVAWFAHRRIREKPPSGGVSVLCESVAADPLIRRHSERLLQSVNWFGPAMVEYRIAHDGTPYLMEVNGRFWGSLQLAIDSGIDFPWALFELLRNQPSDVQPQYQVGKRLRWLLGDVDNLLIQLRGGHPGTSRAKACAAFLCAFFDRASRQEILRLSDPAPALLELKTWAKALL